MVAGTTASASRNNNTQGYRTMQRTVHVNSRGRRSGVIVGTRPLVPASVVPEELINQVIVYTVLKSQAPCGMNSGHCNRVNVPLKLYHLPFFKQQK